MLAINPWASLGKSLRLAAAAEQVDEASMHASCSLCVCVCVCLCWFAHAFKGQAQIGRALLSLKVSGARHVCVLVSNTICTKKIQDGSFVFANGLKSCNSLHDQN